MGMSGYKTIFAYLWELRSQTLAISHKSVSSQVTSGEETINELIQDGFCLIVPSLNSKLRLIFNILDNGFLTTKNGTANRPSNHPENREKENIKE